MKIEITKRVIFGCEEFYAKVPGRPETTSYGGTEQEAIEGLKFKLLQEQQSSEETYVVDLEIDIKKGK